MKTDVIIDIVYLILMAICVIIDNNVVKSWWSFLFGATIALAARNVLFELSGRNLRRHPRRVR